MRLWCRRCRSLGSRRGRKLRLGEARHGARYPGEYQLLEVVVEVVEEGKMHWKRCRAFVYCWMIIRIQTKLFRR